MNEKWSRVDGQIIIKEEENSEKRENCWFFFSVYFRKYSVWTTEIICSFSCHSTNCKTDQFTYSVVRTLSLVWYWKWKKILWKRQNMYILYKNVSRILIELALFVGSIVQEKNRVKRGKGYRTFYFSSIDDGMFACLLLILLTMICNQWSRRLSFIRRICDCLDRNVQVERERFLHSFT